MVMLPDHANRTTWFVDIIIMQAPWAHIGQINAIVFNILSCHFIFIEF